ncbi:hypothetical protein J437_LFUL017575 [Ladona fulva]|uniref:Uncharacterized protein n=1 Tax=Ladona fulva TaxID=123851 RepID=A0A8K0KRG3_LADFU|nr:hypothetical protein J437_LFUL017575 [Ladona fulva]
MQPLDKVFFKPLKDYLSQMSDNCLLNHPGITNYQISEIFGQAYERTATMGKGIKGFELCGIFPVNRNVFSDDDFLPSPVTDQPMPVDNASQSTSQCDILPIRHSLLDGGRLADAFSITPGRNIFNSDHESLDATFTISAKATSRRVPSPQAQPFRAWAKVQWSDVNRCLSLIPWSMLDSLPLQEAMELFYDLLNAVINDHAPLIRPSGLKVTRSFIYTTKTKRGIYGRIFLMDIQKK